MGSSFFTDLKTSYSTVSGANKAHLIAQLFRASISEGEDPIPVLGAIRSAQITLAQCGLSLHDEILAHAMLLALPVNVTMQTLLVQ